MSETACSTSSESMASKKSSTRPIAASCSKTSVPSKSFSSITLSLAHRLRGFVEERARIGRVVGACGGVFEDERDLARGLGEWARGGRRARVGRGRRGNHAAGHELAPQVLCAWGDVFAVG